MTLAPSSLRGRITFAGVLVVGVLVLALDVFVYFSLRERMLSDLDAVLAARAQLVTGLSRDHPPLQLATRLQELGVRAIVRTPDGDEYLSGGAPPFEDIPAGRGGDRLAARSVPLDDGVDVVVLASRGGIDSTLRRLLVLEVVGTAAVVAIAALALSRASRRVLRPVRDVARTARDIADGDLQRRLPGREEDEELAEMVTAFNDMLDALERALALARDSEETSRRFLADAAHQLRTPAAGIRASVATMLRTGRPEERERLLDNLAGETARMSRLLSSLLRIARLDTGEIPRFVPTDLGELVAGVVDRHRTMGPRLRFQTDVAPGATAEVDAGNIVEALDNLVDNAARNARERVTVRVHPVPDGDAIEIAVEDDGPGVPPAERDRIFDRFVSLDDGGGSGLGLPISRGIAEAHGGSLEYRDGAFILLLPAVPPVAVGRLRP